MDRYLFGKFLFEMDDELYDNTCIAFAKAAENMVRTPKADKITFNYYPLESSCLQFVTEAVQDNNRLRINGVRIHHTSEDVWKLKIVTAIEECDNSYLATRPDGNGLIALRLVNEQVLGDIEADSIVEAQMVAFAVDANIYQDDEAYKNSVPPGKDGHKILMKDGLIVATDFVVNNSAHLTDEERNAKEHCFDNLVDVCGTITRCYKFPLNMFDMKLNTYYAANIMTDFGQLKVIIAQALFPKDLSYFEVGNVFVGKVMLSGDVCIYDYEKYTTLMNK